MDMSFFKLWEMVEVREGWCAACTSWGRKEPDMTQWVNNNNNFSAAWSKWNILLLFLQSSMNLQERENDYKDLVFKI